MIVNHDLFVDMRTFLTFREKNKIRILYIVRKISFRLFLHRFRVSFHKFAFHTCCSHHVNKTVRRIENDFQPKCCAIMKEDIFSLFFDNGRKIPNDLVQLDSVFLIL